MTQNKKTIYGLVGGSGAGKSTISGLFKELNAYIIDADKIGHKILEKDNLAYHEVISYFGNEILDADKNIVRKNLGKIVFNDKNKLDALNKITHKYIIEEIESRTTQHKIIVIDAAVLIESGMYKICDKIIVVYATEETRLQRIVERDGITVEMAKNRINSQLKFCEMLKYADIIVVNG